jgi:hypothetical protein
MFATNVVYPALASADQFIIGSAMGVTAVTHYAVPMSLVQRSGAIPVAFGRTFFPRMSSLSGDAAFALGARALSSMASGFAAICAPAMILSPTFFRYWLGADFAVVAAPVAQVLFPGMWMFSLSFVGFTLLQSQGRADVTGKLNIIEFLPFVAILCVLTQSFGSLAQPLLGACGAYWLAVHIGCVGDAVAFRNEEKGASSFVATGHAFGGSTGHDSLSGLEYSRKLPCCDRGRIRVPRPRVSVLRRLAHAHSGADEPSARCPRQPDQPG